MSNTVLVDPAHPDPAAIASAAAVLAGGGLVAFPTETVYGLGADALDEGAVRRVFAAKRRQQDNPLIVHLATATDLDEIVAAITPLAARLASRWWPGPLTLVLEAAPTVPAVTTGGLSTVAVRVPAHPVALALLRAAGVPVAAPSANRSGRPSPTTAAHVAADLGAAVDVIVDGGPCSLGVESTVVDARGAIPVVLREGAVTREDLSLSDPGLSDPGVADPDAAIHEDGPTSSPGTRYRHYAPSCAVEVAPPGRAAERAAQLAARGAKVALVGSEAAPAGVLGLAVVDGPEALARILYDALRNAEDAGVDVVVVEAVPEQGLGRAVMDRLRRAAAP